MKNETFPVSLCFWYKPVDDLFKLLNDAGECGFLCEGLGSDFSRRLLLFRRTQQGCFVVKLKQKCFVDYKTSPNVALGVRVWVHSDSVFFFGWTVPLSCSFSFCCMWSLQEQKHEVQWEQKQRVAPLLAAVCMWEHSWAEHTCLQTEEPVSSIWRRGPLPPLRLRHVSWKNSQSSPLQFPTREQNKGVDDSFCQPSTGLVI